MALATALSACGGTRQVPFPTEAADAGQDGSLEDASVDVRADAGVDLPDEVGPVDTGTDPIPDTLDHGDEGDAAPDMAEDSPSDDTDGGAVGAVCFAGGVEGTCVSSTGCDGDWSSADCSSASLGCCTDPAAIRCTADGRPGECIDISLCVGDRSPTPGLCPGPAEIQCCTARPADACDPEAMPQPNAGLVEAPGVGGCPDGMTPVDDFCIDVFEAALVEVLQDESTSPWSPYHNPGTRRVRAVSIAGAVPQGYISGTQAKNACEEAGKRLCTDAEWLRACRGTESWVYPYGPVEEPGACNEDRPLHPAVEYFGTTDDWIWSALGNACINQLEDSLATTGSYVDCVTPEGVYDIVGNLHEWTADPAGTFRGGFYVDTWRNGESCLYATTAHNTEHWDYSTGFRCCAD